MLGPGQYALGIHVAEGRLRVVALRGGSAGPTLAAVHDDAIPLVAVEHSGAIRDPRTLAGAVAAWASANGINPSSATASLAVSGGSVLVRSLELGPEAASDIESAVRAHVEHYSLFSMGDEVVGYDVDERQGAQGERRPQVTLSATSRQVAEPAWAVLQELGGRAQCVEASSLAACRAMAFVGELNVETAAPSLVLFLTSRRTEVLAIAGRAVLFSHMLDLQLEDLVGADARGAAEGYERVAEEVARCVQFFRRQFRGAEPVQQILFVSDVPFADEFYQKTTQLTGMPARASAPWAGIPVEGEGVGVRGSALAAALGAALRAAEASDAFCIPLATARPAKRKLDLAGILKTLAPGVVLLLCFAAASAATWVAARSAVHQEQFVAEQIAREQAGIRESTGGLSAEQKRHLLDAVEANKSLASAGRATRPPDVIAAAVAALPPGAAIQSMSIDKDGDISLKGSARTEADAVALARGFEAADVIALARLSSLRAAEQHGQPYFEFDIVASVQ